MFNKRPDIREDVYSAKVVPFTSDTTGCTDKVPVGLYYDEDGVVMGKKIAIDANSRRGSFGIVTGGDVAASASGQAIVAGKATIVTNSTAGYPITAVSNAGVATDSVAYSSSNVDVCLGVSTDTSGGIILL